MMIMKRIMVKNGTNDVDEIVILMRMMIMMLITTMILMV